MAEFTVYTDESGNFHPNSKPLGRRAVVALALRSGAAVCEEKLARRIGEAAGFFGMPFHANKCAHVVDIAASLRAALGDGRLPGMSAELAAVIHSGVRPTRDWTVQPTRTALYRELMNLGHVRLDGVRTEIGRLMRELQGFFLVSLEHSRPTNDENRWKPMVHAALVEVLFRIAAIPGGPHRVEIIPAESGGPNEFDLSLAIELIEGARQHGVPMQRLDLSPSVAVPTRLAADFVGIQAADVLAHTFGPRSRGSYPVSGAEARSTDLRSLHQEFRAKFGSPVKDELRAGAATRDTHGEVVGMAEDLGQAGREDLNPLQAKRRARLAEAGRRLTMVFLASVQGSEKTVDELARLE
jgi:hypothetical protein